MAGNTPARRSLRHLRDLGSGHVGQLVADPDQAIDSDGGQQPPQNQTGDERLHGSPP